jgi:hypothetical protein
MGERPKNLARSRKAAARTPVTVLARIHVQCREGMHIACPGTVGRRTKQECLCGCHKGVITKLRAAR